jgi:integrase
VNLMDRRNPTRRATGHIRTIERADGLVLYAKLRLPDGTQSTRKLGRLWERRTRPPAGYLTMGMAEARLAAILAGDDAMVNITPTRLDFAAACAEYLAYVEHDRQRRPSTVRDYRSSIKGLVAHFGASTLVDDITTIDIDAYRSGLIGKRKARTINKQLILLGGIFRLAVRRHGLRVNPAANADRQPQKDSGDFQYLEPGEVTLLANAAASKQEAAFYIVAAFTGLRLGELRALRWRDIDFTNANLHVRRSLVMSTEDTPKSHEVRSVPLIDQAAKVLDGLSRRERFTDPGDHVFVDDVGEPMSGDVLRNRFVKARDSAGLTRPRPHPQDMRMHDLRHTFGTLGARVWPVTTLQGYMGHADLSTTMRYVHHVPKVADAAKLGALVADVESVPPAVPPTEQKSLQVSEPHDA